MFKIESFSSLVGALTKTKYDKYDSCHFEAGGYKWNLSLYPNGNKIKGGDGYVSLYLTLVEPESPPQSEEVYVIFKFFVFNFFRDNYLVLQDGRERKFYEFNTEWGFAKMLSRRTFNDPSQGYLVDDCCMFGVELFLHKNSKKQRSSLSMKKNVKVGQSIFPWKVDKFSTLSQKLVSDKFCVGGVKWSLWLYPKGDYRAKGKCMSLFLCVHEHSCLPCGWSIYAEYKLRILDQRNQKHHAITADGFWFGHNRHGYGFPKFLELSDLTDASRGFIVNDTAIIEVEIMINSVVNNLP